jgi:hypothetical protein
MSVKEFLKSVLQKLSSTKFWITAWAGFLVTWIVIKNLQSFANIAMILCAVPVSYIGANVVLDAIWSKVK